MQLLSSSSEERQPSAVFQEVRRHSAQPGSILGLRDSESRKFTSIWIPASAGMINEQRAD
jgi:hypothetical protein